VIRAKLKTMKAQNKIRGWSRRQFVSGGVVAGTSGLLTALPLTAHAAEETPPVTVPVAKVRYAILEQLQRAGFRAVFADGHGPSRWSWAENLKERETRFGLKLFGVTSEVAKDWKSQMDHAARNETSLMMHYRPELVDLAQLPAARSEWPQGVGGEDPRDATAAHGKQCLQASVEVVRRLFSRAGLL